jgi:hypothetical protein
MTTLQTRTESEDWIKTRRWDLPTDLAGLTQALGYPLTMKGKDFPRWKALRDLTTLPAYKMCPPQLAHQIEMYIGRKPRTRWVSLVKAFNEDESRDSAGKWTSGAGDAAGDAANDATDMKQLRASMLRRSIKESKPTKSMKKLTQREVKTVGDIRPGDVIRMADSLKGEPGALITIEHTATTNVRPYTTMIGRTPTGRMTQHQAPANSILGAKNPDGFADMNEHNTPGWTYVGSETVKTNSFGAPRDDVKISGFGPHVQHQIRQSISLIEAATPPGTLNGLRIGAGVLGGNTYAHYLQPRNLTSGLQGTPTIEFNHNFITSPQLDMHDDDAEAGKMWDLGGSYTSTVTSKFHPSRNGYGAITTILTHEIGHHLDYKVTQGDMGDDARYERLNLQNELIGLGDAVLSPEIRQKVVKSSVSDYANKTFGEFMAEAFSEGMLADRPRPVARLVKKILTGAPITVGDTDAAHKQLYAHVAPVTVSQRHQDLYGHSIGALD